MDDTRLARTTGGTITGIVPSDLAQVERVATLMVNSGLFGDPHDRTFGEVVVKMLRGMEMGIPPVASIMGMHVIEGKPSLSSGLLGARLKMHPRYDYQVVEHSAEAASALLYQDGKPQHLTDVKTGEQLPWSYRVTMEQALAANWHQYWHKRDKKWVTKKPWKETPANMLWARCISGLVRTYAPEVTYGAVYAEGEIEEPSGERGAIRVSGGYGPDGPLDQVVEVVDVTPAPRPEPVEHDPEPPTFGLDPYATPDLPDPE